MLIFPYIATLSAGRIHPHPRSSSTTPENW